MLQLEQTREAAKIISDILLDLSSMVGVGVNLLEIEDAADRLMRKYKVTSYNEGYQPKWSKIPYPAILCLSVNDVLNHGVPHDYNLQDGDIITIDTGIKYKEVVGDAALTVPVGTITNKNDRLIRYAKKATYFGIDQISDGSEVSAVGRAIDLFCRRMGFRVNEYLSGHGIGTEMHQEPSIPMFDVTSRLLPGAEVPRFKAGQVVCIEPHLTFDTPHATLDEKDQFSVITLDHKPAAMFEHMVEVLPDGYNILTNHFSLSHD